MLLFINKQKYTYKLNQFTSDFSVLDLFFNLLSNVVSMTSQFTLHSFKSQLTDKQIASAKIELQKGISLFLNKLMKNKLVSMPFYIETPFSFAILPKSSKKTVESQQISQSKNNKKDILVKVKERIRSRHLNLSMDDEQNEHNQIKHTITVHSLNKAHKTNNKKQHHFTVIASLPCRSPSSYYITSKSAIYEKREKSKDDAKGDIKPSAFDTHLINRYQNVRDRYYSIKTQEDEKYKYNEGKRL